MRSLNIAATGMLAQQLNVEVISNNIANLNTTGFKRQRAEFQDLLYQDEERVGSTSSDTGTIIPSGIQLGLGVKTGAVYRIGEQGNLVATGQHLRPGRSRGAASSRSGCRRATRPIRGPARSSFRPPARSSPPRAMRSIPASPSRPTR